MIALAILLAVPSPQPSPDLKTIVTVKSSPYCDALKNHVNAAFVPMLANDDTLEAAGMQLDDLDKVFTKPTYAQDYISIRLRLLKMVETIERSLPQVASEIAQLRAAKASTADPAAAKGLSNAIDDLQTAFDKQKQIVVDLHNMVQAMMDFDPLSVNPPPGGMDPRDIGLPADMKSIKAYLRYDGRRDAMVRAQNTAIDAALDLAEKECSPD